MITDHPHDWTAEDITNSRAADAAADRVRELCAAEDLDEGIIRALAGGAWTEVFVGGQAHLGVATAADKIAMLATGRAKVQRVIEAL